MILVTYFLAPLWRHEESGLSVVKLMWPIYQQHQHHLGILLKFGVLLFLTLSTWVKLKIICLPLVSHLISAGPCPFSVPQLFYVSRIGILLSQSCWEAKWTVYHFAFPESSFAQTYMKVNWELYFLYICLFYICLLLFTFWPFYQPPKKMSPLLWGKPIYIGSLPCVLWSVPELLNLSYCTRSEGRDITCVLVTVPGLAGGMWQVANVQHYCVAESL